MNLHSFSLSPYFVPSWIIFGFPEKRVLKSPLFQCLIPCFKNIGMGSFLVASWPLQIQLMISQVIITTSDKFFSGRIWGQNISLQFMRFGLINSHNDERSGLFVWMRRNQYLASLAWSSFGRGGPVNNSASDAKRKIPRWAWTVEYYWYAKFCCCLNISASDSSWKMQVGQTLYYIVDKISLGMNISQLHCSHLSPNSQSMYFSFFVFTQGWDFDALFQEFTEWRFLILSLFRCRGVWPMMPDEVTR